MDLFSVVQDQEKLDSVSYLGDEAGRISGHAATFVRRLFKVFSDDRVSQRWNTSFVIADDGVTAQIDSPFGRAHCSLVMVINDDNHVEGQWIIRKELLDHDGESTSVKVASFRVLINGHIFLGAAQEHPIPASNRLLGDEDRTAYQTASSILYAIGRSEQ